MLEILIHARDGQGAQVAGEILAGTFVRRGHVTSVFTTRAEDDDERLAVHVSVETSPGCPDGPDHVLVLDPGLLESAITAVRVGSTVLVNSPVAPCSRLRGSANVKTVDATAIAAQLGLGSTVGTVMLGAFGALTQLFWLRELFAAIREWSSGPAGPDIEAARAGWKEASALIGVGG